MRALVLPDIHLKPWIFDLAEKLISEPSYRIDTAVCTMDIADNWNSDWDVSMYRETYDRAIIFAKEHPDTLWCYGNHDVSYIWGKLESGYNPYAERIVITKLEELKSSLRNPNDIAIIHRIDNVLFSHGGLSEEYVEWLGGDNLIHADIDDVIARINNSNPELLWRDESPLWLRPQIWHVIHAYRSDKYIQVVGHTPVKRISFKNGFISTDVFSTYRNGKQIGRSEMLIVDSVTKEYVIIPVAGLARKARGAEVIQLFPDGVK